MLAFNRRPRSVLLVLPSHSHISIITHDAIQQMLVLPYRIAFTIETQPETGSTFLSSADFMPH